jgi:hypothetical protein
MFAVPYVDAKSNTLLHVDVEDPDTPVVTTACKLQSFFPAYSASSILSSPGQAIDSLHVSITAN